MHADTYATQEERIHVQAYSWSGILGRWDYGLHHFGYMDCGLWIVDSSFVDSGLQNSVSWNAVIRILVIWIMDSGEHVLQLASVKEFSDPDYGDPD
jgi:hypothetical protein